MENIGKENMEKIEIPLENFPNEGLAIKYAVMLLKMYNAEGKRAYCEILGHTLYSDTVTEEDAIKQITGYKADDYARLQAAEKQLEEAYKQVREAERIIEEIKKKAEKEAQQEELDKYRKQGEKVVITAPLVVSGLKYIVENLQLSRKELSKGLMNLGCTFTWEEIYEQFPEKVVVARGLMEGNLRAGAVIIANVRDSDYGLAMVLDEFLSKTSKVSIYNFIKIVTSDPGYTDESSNEATNSKKSKR